MLIGYARTSTLDQKASIEAQVRDLNAIGCEKVFEEQVSSVRSLWSDQPRPQSQDLPPLDGTLSVAAGQRGGKVRLACLNRPRACESSRCLPDCVSMKWCIDF